MSVTFDPSNYLSGFNVAIEVEWGREERRGEEEPEVGRERTGLYLYVRGWRRNVTYKQNITDKQEIGQ